MPHHRLARLATSRVVITGALTLTSALGVGTLQGPTEEAVYGVSSVGGLTRLSADTVAERSKALAEAQSGGEAAGTEAGAAQGGLQRRTEPGWAAQLERVGPKVRTAEKPDAPAPEGEAEVDAELEGEAEAAEPPPPPPPPPPAPPTDPVWSSLAACESSGNWQTDTGNGYYGGLQFSLESWHGVGGTGYPHEHPREVQIEMAERLKSHQGWNAWPTCSRRLGLI
jgi:hypothetical protein